MLLPLLIADPSLPEEVRFALTEDPEEGARALMTLGVSCCDAAELVGLSGEEADC